MPDHPPLPDHGPWTAAKVRALIDESRPNPRYELIDGELLVSTSFPRIHQIVSGEFLSALDRYLEVQRVGEVLPSPSDLELEPDTLVQPDLFVIPASIGRIRDWPDVNRLLLAVEVLTPATSRTDRLTKRLFFQRLRVPEYWIVDSDGRIVERWTPDDERPAVLDSVLTWHPPGAAEPLTLDLVGLFRRVWGERD